MSQTHRVLSDTAVDELLEDFEVLAFEQRLVSARVLLDAIEAALAPDDAERLYARALFIWASEGPNHDAQTFLEKAVSVAPEFADARHALGRLADLRGDFELMRAQFVEVLRLDSEVEPAAQDPEILDEVERVASEVFRSIPEQFRNRLENVPIVLEGRPRAGLVAEGFDPRALGLFEGQEHAQAGTSFQEGDQAPTRIVLFYENLHAAFRDPAQLAEEIEVTLLHEIGHFFGLDEHEVEALGLA